jgi:predicted transcriptional regulator
MRLIKKGLPYKEIAAECGISSATVRNYAKFGPPQTYEPPLKEFATSTKVCEEHRCYMPCAACAAWREARKNQPDLRPVDQFHEIAEAGHQRFARQEYSRLLNEADDFVNPWELRE